MLSSWQFFSDILFSAKPAFTEPERASRDGFSGNILYFKTENPNTQAWWDGTNLTPEFDHQNPGKAERRDPTPQENTAPSDSQEKKAYPSEGMTSS